MTNQEPPSPLNQGLSPHVEDLLKQSFVVVPTDFDSRIVYKLPKINRSETIELPHRTSVLSKLFMLCRWGVMTVGGTLAATEVITFVFSFWAAGTAL
jgi:hypothetical protein